MESNSAFLFLRSHLAVDTLGSNGPCLEAGLADILSAVVTYTELSGLYAVDRILDFINQFPLPVPDAKLEVAI